MPKDQQIKTHFLDNYITKERGEYPMKNKNHHIDDIDFRIYLVEEGDNLFVQEEATPVQSAVTLSQLQFLQRHNMLPRKYSHPVSNPINGGIKEDFIPPFYEEKRGYVQEEGHISFLDEYYHQHEGGNCFPFSFSSFE